MGAHIFYFMCCVKINCIHLAKHIQNNTKVTSDISIKSLVDHHNKCVVINQLMGQCINSHHRLQTLPSWQEGCPSCSLPSSLQQSLGPLLTEELHKLKFTKH